MERKIYTTSSYPYYSRNPLEYRHEQTQSVRVLTTLYEVIEAVSAQVPPEEEYLVTPAVLKQFRDFMAGFLLHGSD